MKVTIYSDGGADPNPGYGGWAAILQYGGHEKVLTGNTPHTTNNRMELQAAIEALKALKRPCEIDFYTDSQYVQRGITEWIEEWAADGWQKKDKPIPNVDLWQTLWSLTHKHQIEWHWVKGHAGDPLNERVDQLATEARLVITPEQEIDMALPRLYVRASYLGKSNCGGWGAVLEQGPAESAQTTQISGSARDTTNNRMEITAALEGLKLMPEGASVQIFTVSNYVYQGATQWINGWRRRDWQKKGGTPIANADLWRELDAVMQQRNVIWVNAKGEQMPSEGLREANALAVAAAKNEALDG